MKTIEELIIMDCPTAQAVYVSDNADQVLANIRTKFSLAWDYLTVEVQNFVDRQSDPFDTEVKQSLGVEYPNNFRVTHRDDDSNLSVQIAELLGDLTSRFLLQDYFTKLHSTPIFLGTICCSGCITTDRELTLPELLSIQAAAVKIEPTAYN